LDGLIEDVDRIGVKLALRSGSGCDRARRCSVQRIGNYLYVERVDDTFKKAIAAGAKELQPLKDQFCGDRSGTVQDPFGHVWTIATHVEDVPPEELRKRAEAARKQHTHA